MIEKRISKRIGSIPSSATAEVTIRTTELRKKGIAVIDCGAGDPDFGTPAHIKEALIDALHEGFTHYTESKGILELREAIVEKLETENGVKVTPHQIVITPGGKSALLSTILAVVDPGDEVILINPAWVSYEPMVKIAGGIIKRVPLKESVELRIQRRDLEEKISANTKILVLNTPNNPCGRVFKKEELQIDISMR